MWCMHKPDIKELSFLKSSDLSVMPLTQICTADPRVREDIRPEGAFSARPYSLCVKARMLDLTGLEAITRDSRV